MCNMTCQPPWLTKAEVLRLRDQFPLVMKRKNRVRKLLQHAYGNGKHLKPQYRYQLLAIRRDIVRHYGASPFIKV